MNCPLCIDKTLEPIQHSGIEIDCCPTCNGIWLDRDEIEKLASAPEQQFDRGKYNDQKQRSWDDDRDDDDDDDDDRDDDRRGDRDGERKPKKRKSRVRLFAERLADALEDILDL